LHNLFFLPLAVLLTGCTNAGMGSIDWRMPGKPESLTCYEMMGEETTNFQAHAYCATGEYPHLCDC
tara:strand:+ start:1060 stop:1257 length:198 start_codon:yes stop_codon:yes gene_type:complete